MSKKVIDDEEELDDFYNEIENVESVKEEEIDSDSCDEDEDIQSRINDDDDNIDIVIEIDDDDLNISDLKDDSEIDNSEDCEITLSKHKLEGKHSLKYDSIFKGKKDAVEEEDAFDGFGMYYKDSIEVDKSSNY